MEAHAKAVWRRQVADFVNKNDHFIDYHNKAVSIPIKVLDLGVTDAAKHPPVALLAQRRVLAHSLLQQDAACRKVGRRTSQSAR